MSKNERESPNGAALFEAANKLRGSVDSAEYKHLVLGLLFLKYISDAFEQRRGELEAELCDPSSESYISDPRQVAEVLDDRDEYAAENVFWVSEQARWPALLAAASQPDIAAGLIRRLRRSSERTRACATCSRACTPAHRCRRS
jgi:type I restriction enzyme M protein